MAGKSKIYGFGFNPEETHHHFLLYIPGVKTAEFMYIFEYYEWEENRDVQQSVFELEQNPACRVRMTMDRWKGIALKNWLGLFREERWWLSTMTNVATGQALNHRGIGWRKAVRYALTENPVIDVVEKRTFNLLKTDEKQNKPKTKNRKKSLDKKQLSLFDINESG
jgi:hypothetical protein